MSKLAAIAISATALAFAGGILAGQSSAEPSRGCKVVDLAVTVEAAPLKFDQTEPKGYRWVRAETVKCGSDRITMTTRGEWQRHSPVH